MDSCNDALMPHSPTPRCAVSVTVAAYVEPMPSLQQAPTTALEC